MISIKVYNSFGKFAYLDLLPNTQLSIQEKMAAFDPKLESGMFSLPIEIPWTSHNRSWLGYVENLHSNTAASPEYWRCDIEDKMIPFVQNAKLKLIESAGNLNLKEGKYNFMITGVKGLFGSLIKNKNLRDLDLGGIISWDIGKDSREFAMDVMTGLRPEVFEKLKFAPVAIFDYIDNSRKDFNTEFLNNDIVNNVIIDASYTNGWLFGRNNPLLSPPEVAKGDEGYDNYRTIPFLRLTYVLRAIFLEHGFNVTGNFFSFPSIDKVHIYNTVAIDRFDYPFTDDYNTQLTPSRHLPDMLIADFLTAICNAFNLRIVFSMNQTVSINFNQQLLSSNRIKDFSSKAHSVYNGHKRHPIYENGYKIAFKFDSADSFASDKVKDIRKIEVIAEVDLRADIAGLSFSFPLDEKHYILVRNENYFYNYNPSTSEWIPMLENLDAIRVGKEEVSFEAELAPLCSWYLDNGSGTLQRQNIVAAHQNGNYYNDGKIFVENEFGLRLFFIDQFTTGAYTDLPYTFIHDTMPDGSKLAEFSLALLGQKGLFNNCFKKWIAMLQNSFLIKMNFALDLLDILTIAESDIVQVNGLHFLIENLQYNLPVEESTEIDLINL